MLRRVLESGLLLSCITMLGYCVKLLGSWMLGAVEKLVCYARLVRCLSTAEVAATRVLSKGCWMFGAVMLGVLVLSEEVVLGTSLLLDIAIEAASVGVLRKAVNVVLLLSELLG